MENISWVKIDSWHAIESTTTDGNVWTVHTRCGIVRMWDGTSIDRLPGGGEHSCELCLRIMARALEGPAEEPVKAKRARKAK